MTVVDELTIAFKADIADLKAGMSQIKSELGEVQKSAKALSLIEAGEALKGMGQGFTQNVTTPILGFFQESIKASSDNAEEVSKLKQLFGGLTPEVEKWISTTSTAMGRGEDMVRSFASSFGAVLTPQFADNKKKAAELAEGYTKLAIDLASFFNTTEEEAKAALMSGISGETEPLRKYGVMLSEEKLKAEAAKFALQGETDAVTQGAIARKDAADIAAKQANIDLLRLEQSGKATDAELKAAKAKVESAERTAKLIDLEVGDIAVKKEKKVVLDDATKQQAIYSLVIKGTTAAQGDAARTSDGWANTMRALEGMMKSVQVAIGDVLLPVLLPLAAALKDALAWFKALDPGIMRIVVVGGILAAAIGPVLIAVGGLVGMFGSMLAIIGTGGLAAGFTALTGAIVPLIAPVLAVVGAVALLVGGFAVMYTSSEKFRGMISGIVTGVVEMGTAFIEWITPIKDTIVAAVMPALKNMGDFLGEQFQKIASWVKGEGRSFIDFLGAIAEGFQTTIVNGIKVLGGIYRDYLEPILKWLISTALDGILGKLKDLGDWFKSPQVQQAIKDVGKALEDFWKWLGEIGTLIKTTVLPALDEFFGRFDSQHQDGLAGTISLLKLLWEAGDAIAKLMRGDLAGAYDAAKTFNNDLNEAIKNGLNPTLGDAKAALGDVTTETGKAGKAAADAKPQLSGLKSPLDDIDKSGHNAAGGIGAITTALNNYSSALGRFQSSPSPSSLLDLAAAMKGLATATSNSGKAASTTTGSTTTTTTTTPADRTSGNPGTTGNKTGNPDVEYGGPSDTSATPPAQTFVRNYIQDGYIWNVWGDGHVTRGPRAGSTAPTGGGDRHAFAASGISLVINNPVAESASKSLDRARSLARRLGSGSAVI